MAMVNENDLIQLPNGQWIAAGLAGPVVGGKVKVNDDTIVKPAGSGNIPGQRDNVGVGADGQFTYTPGGPRDDNPIYGAPSPAASLDAEAAPKKPARDFASEARLLFPWIPDALRQVFVDAWTKYGDPNVALGALRQDSRYEQFFPGNRRPDGTIALDEGSYLSTIDGYDRRLRMFGQDPSHFQSRYAELIQGGKSPDEFEADLATTWQEVIASGPTSRAWYAANGYAADVSDEAIFASRLQPGVSPQEFDQRFRMARIGGAAANFGFTVERSQAQKLAELNVTADQAQQLYAKAAGELPTLQELMARHNDPGDEFTLDNFTDAVVLHDPHHLQTIGRLLSEEGSLFAPQNLLGVDREGGVAGLRAR